MIVGEHPLLSCVHGSHLLRPEHDLRRVYYRIVNRTAFDAPEIASVTRATYSPGTLSFHAYFDVHCLVENAPEASGPA